jgi:hypothetical protein
MRNLPDHADAEYLDKAGITGPAAEAYVHARRALPDVQEDNSGAIGATVIGTILSLPFWLVVIAVLSRKAHPAIAEISLVLALGILCFSIDRLRRRG